MKVKLLLKFYFNAAELNERLDRLITYNACKEGWSSFDRVTTLIDDKSRLCSLMDYLKGKFEKLTKNDEMALKKYSELRVGVRNLKDEERREIKRAAMKFTRKLTFIERFSEELCVLQKYRAILIAPQICPD